MLVDTPENLAYRYGDDPLLDEIGMLTNPGMLLAVSPRLGTGVYLGHLNSLLSMRSVIKNEHPFMDEARASMAENQKRLDAGLRAIPYDWENAPSEYGVCDDYEQILFRWPSIETDPRHFQIWLSEVRREHQSPSGGWRWHKWGPYVGTYDIKNEYLYDEDIEVVYPFHIIEVTF